MSTRLPPRAASGLAAFAGFIGFTGFALLVCLFGEPGEAVAQAAPDATPAASSGLEIELHSASAGKGGRSVLLAARLRNGGAEDLLVLLSEAHVVDPSSEEAGCTADSARFSTLPVVRLRSDDVGGGELCDQPSRSTRANWTRSVLRVRAGETATVVLEVRLRRGGLPAPEDGVLEAQLALSWTPVEGAPERLVSRASSLGRGFLMSGRMPGGAKIGPQGLKGKAAQAAVLFTERTLSDAVVVDLH